MTRLILASLVLAIFILPLYAQTSSLHTDRSGYTTGTDGNRTVNTYTDRYGNTTGWVGGKYMSTYSDSYGGTTGTIGNKRITTYEDGYGNTTGTIGSRKIKQASGTPPADAEGLRQRRGKAQANQGRRRPIRHRRHLQQCAKIPGGHRLPAQSFIVVRHTTCRHRQAPRSGSPTMKRGSSAGPG
jgi:hypothetical protein